MAGEKRKYRLGLDLGSNSIGWFVIWLDAVGEAVGLGPGGVRIFPDGRDPQSKESNAKDRRIARGMRRRRDRYLARRKALMAALVKHGLMPADMAARKALESLDPYALREAALEGALPLHHIGRVLFHLNQRRGFKSNRKTDSGDGESGKIKEAASRLNEQMEATGARTLGQFFARRHGQKLAVRARMKGAGAKAFYDFYPTRPLIEEEFNAIWEGQKAHHAALSDAARAEIHHIIFFQRPLRSPPAGKCSLSPATGPDDAEGFRLPLAHPLAQRFRIWQEVRNLRIVETGKPARELTREQGDLIARALFGSKEVAFDKIRSLLKLPPEARFNLEDQRRDKLKGDETAARLSSSKLFGKGWHHLALERRGEIVDHLLNDENEGHLIAWLSTEAGLDAEVSARVAGTGLPDGHSRLGLRAIRAILPHMEAGLDYARACKEAGYDHSLGPTGEVVDRLPYYGEWLQNDVMGTGDPKDPPEKRFGRLPNPTVHIGLGQLRRIVNALIDRFGPPDEAVVEMTRSFKLSPAKLAEVEREQAKNQRRNDERRVELQKLGQAENHRNLMKLRLWEELNPRDPLDRRCPFTGDQISIEKLFSNEVEIEHLIPFQMCFDDSAANKVVAMRHANRFKGKKTPYQAFGHSPAGFDWEGIGARASSLPFNKRWRFGPDAHERYKAEGGFLARQLNETGWLSRMAKDYLQAVTGPYKVWVVPGRHTAMIRAKWGLNSLLPDHNFTDEKNRADHRHHAIDAMVAGLTDRSLLQSMASTYDEERDKIEVEKPWTSLRDDLSARLAAMTVSYKPEHGVGGRLHEETAYGLVKDPAREDGNNLVYRKAFTALKEPEIARIRDRRLRDMVAAHWAEAKQAGLKIEEALQSFAATVSDRHVANGIRHVRILKPEAPAYLVQVAEGEGAPYKAYSAGANAFVDILETADGKWVGEAATVFAANQPGYVPSWRNRGDLRFVMRVFKGDLICLTQAGEARVFVVRQLDQSNNRMKLAQNNEAGSLQDRHNNPDDPFRWLMASYSTLKSMNARRVRVDELGTVWNIPPQQALRSL